MTYSFEKEAASAARVRERIAAERTRHEDRRKKLIDSGHLDSGRALSRDFHERMDELYDERDYYIQRMPPFTTWDEAMQCLARHPVTPENKHLFK